ncbi:MAG: penicillin acylase family protein [Candidatus Kapabacteria bacterium]|nr:penicillin acylase family protein [Ignavibacteriota bacterium]MCW5884112.1 penicillin acylase family protein [Candidatus Kapabacteria bacterium]
MALEFFHYRRVTALVVSIIIIAIAFIVFVYKLINVSVVTGTKSYKTEHIKSKAEIYTNFYGIPYFYSENEEDLFFAVGYYQASMRIWQMDYYRRLSEGRLSEIFGETTVKVDKFMRCFDIAEISKRNYDSISGKSRSILDAYSRGVNYFIENNHSRLPLEFNALSYKPEPWQPYHSLMIGRLLTFELSLSIWSDITFGELFEKLGSDKAKLLLPDDDNNFAVFNFPEIIDEKKGRNRSSFSNEVFEIKEILGFGGSSAGSNCWSFKKIDSITGNSAILANDAHLLLGIPARWMQMKIKSGDIDAIGLTVPGLPLILSGRNKHIAWGVTNIMVDGFDYFVEKLDEKQENYYINDSTLKKITYIVDTVLIAGKEPEIYYKRKTGNSFIISDFHILSDPSLFLKFSTDGSSQGMYNNIVLSFKWIGESIGDELFSLYKLNSARTFDDFRDALRHWSAPGLNFHYADKTGNIGVISAGYVPLRETKCNPNLPNPAWIDNYSWKSLVRLQENNFEELNPKENFIASANNKLSDKKDLFVSNYWEPDARYRRIIELLGESDVYNSRTAQFMQNDYYSVYAKELMNICIPVLDNYRNLLEPEEIEFLEIMKNWDYIISRASVHASIYTFYFEKLIFNTFHDEMGDRLYKQYAFVSSLPTRKLISLISMYDSPLFDIQGTTNVENKEFIIFKSFRDALNEFNSYFGNLPIEHRQYGKMHTLTLEHPFSSSDFLKSAVTLGPYETGGNNTTINNAEWNITNPYKHRVGPSMRFIADMNTDFIFSSVPGGSSGDHIHPNFSDQLQIWLNGGYVTLPLDISQTPEDFNLIYKFFH